MNNDYAHGLESVWSSEWGPPSKPEWQEQSQAHELGVQLERHEEGDEGGGQKACKNPLEMALKLLDLVKTTKPPEFLESWSFHSNPFRTLFLIPW